jgi:tRNA(Ile)-lysidine synthase
MAEDSFHRSLREFVLQHQLIEQEDRLILAVSGGLDSMVMLDAISTLRRDFNLSLIVAHFNHQLRGHESEADEAFVRTAAKRLEIECYVEHANTHTAAEAARTSIQETARNLRYAFFAKLRSSLGFHKIATAHHADDNAETVLFNLVRGTGVHGLSGIPIRRPDISVIRPMMFATRDEIRDVAKKKEIAYRTDSSNLSKDYTRNYIRHEIAPRIRENINPNLTLTLRRSSELFHHLDEFLQQQATALEREVIVRSSGKETVFNRDVLLRQHVFMQEYLLFLAVRRHTRLETDFGTIRAMMSICRNETGSSTTVAKDIVFFRDRDHVLLRQLPPATPFRYALDPGKAYEFEHFRFQTSEAAEALFTGDPLVEFVDADRVGASLILRSWVDGDTFVPFGMKNSKKLSDFFVERKVPLFEKMTIPLLVADEGIVWVCGMRLDDRFRISPSTKRILKLEYARRPS